MKNENPIAKKKWSMMHYVLLVLMIVGLSIGGMNISGKSLSKKETIKQYQKALNAISQNYVRLLKAGKFKKNDYLDDQYSSIAARVKGVLDGDYHQMYASYHDLNDDGIVECIVSAKISKKATPLGILTYKNHKIKVVRMINEHAFTGNYEWTIHKNRIYEFYTSDDGGDFYNLGKMTKAGKYQAIVNQKWISRKQTNKMKKNYATDISLADHKIASKIKPWMATYVHEITFSRVFNDYLKHNPKIKKQISKFDGKGEELTYSLVSLDAKTPTLIVTNKNAPKITSSKTWYGIYQYMTKGLKRLSSSSTQIYNHVGTKTFVLRKLSKNKGADTFVQVSSKGVKKLYTVTYKRDHDHFTDG